MFKTRVTELLGVKYPIIAGCLNAISRAEFVAAVANAGAFGFLSSACLGTPEALRLEIKKTKELTDRPFGVNLNMFPSVRPTPNADFVEVIVEEGIKAVETSGASAPTEFVPQLKQGNVKIIHKAATVKHALKGQEVGADAIAIVGMENGGAVGMESVTTLVLVPILVNEAKVPVIAGGGIADGRGLVAALSLGAEAAVMGTRFMATKECPIHDNYKQWLLDATERDTVLVMRSIKNTHRSLRSPTTDRLTGMEARGATLEEMLPIIGREAYEKTAIEGDFEAGLAHAGQAVGLIKDVPSVKELMERTMAEAEKVRQRLNKLEV